MDALDNIAGIIGYSLIKAEDGTIEETKGSSTSPIGDLTAFFSSAAEVIRDSLSTGNINCISLCYGAHRLVIFPHDSRYIGIEVEREVNPVEVIAKIKASLMPKKKEVVEEQVEEEGAEGEELVIEEKVKEEEEEKVEPVVEERVEVAEEDEKVTAEPEEEKVEEEELIVEEKVAAEVEEKVTIELPRSISSKIKQINLLVDEFGGDEQKQHWLDLLNQGLGILGGDIIPFVGVINNELSFKEQPPEEMEDEFVQGLRSIIDFLVKKAVEEMGSSQARAKVQAVIERMK